MSALSSAPAPSSATHARGSRRLPLPSPRPLLRPCLLALTTLAAALALTAAPARAESPWWHLSGGTRPTYLSTGAGTPGQPGVDEVQQLTLHEGELFSVIVSHNLTAEQVENEEWEGPGQSARVEEGESAAEVQAGLESIEDYGAGNVLVEAAGPEAYKVTFRGALAQQPVAPMRLGYKAGRGKVSELAAGRGATAATDGELYIAAENLGDANTSAEHPVKLTDVIPAGLHAIGVAGTKPETGGDFQARVPIPCALEEKAGTQVASCTLSEALAPYDQIEMRVNVKLQGAHSGEVNRFAISGGGAPQSSLERPITLSPAPVPYGAEGDQIALEEEGGEALTQAGAHPFQLTATFTVNQLNDLNPLSDENAQFRPEVTAPGLAKDLSFKLPAGLIGNATSLPQCTTAQFFEVTTGGTEDRCPPASAVGVVTATVHEPATVGTAMLTEPVFNLTPREGEPARFGFYAVQANTPVFLDTSVRSGSDYGATVEVNNITQTAQVLSSEVTFWGVPSDPRHDKQRGWGCLHEAREASTAQPCVPSEDHHPKPFLSLPTSCGSALSTSMRGNSWEAPGSFFEFIGAFEPTTPLTGCNRLQFAPQIKITPDSQQASRPTGVNFDVHVPQELNENAKGQASANIRSLSVTLPAGVSVNPSSADGLAACTEQQVGYLNAKGPAEELLFSPTLPEPFCPDAAKIGTARIKTPLLANPLEGGIYLATPAPNGEGEKNPFNTLVSLYMAFRDPISGVVIKLPGQVSLDKDSGQVSTSFQNTPDLTFEDAEVHLFDGPRAPLASPEHCGTYPVSATFTPWSATAPVTSTASLQVTSGLNGAPCPGSGPLPFSPNLAAGAANNNAGAFANLSTSINREDTDQQLSAVSVHVPPGFSGVLTGVTLCPEEQANAGSCPQNSLIGHSTVSVGLGPDPFTVSGGQVFLTEGYEGAPFGLSISTPAVAGPFDLGNVIVRAKVEVDPHTAALSVTTDETGHPIPHILDGIPLQVRHVNVTIDRQGFTFNPTSCNPQSFSATIKGLQGASATVSSPFQATACQNLKFAPKFTVSTSGKVTKANGTSFSVKIAYPPGPLGTYANLAKVKVSLPKALPSRLSTLNKACTAQTFEANPESCPKESRVGTAKVSTPLLPVPLTGTAYFVSHAAEAFPDLTMVLKGYGITVDLIGNTQIKNGITTSTFKATPDVPFLSFELTLPAQPYSALTANTNICKPGTKLLMPTELQAQNGAEINQNTPITVTGCPKALSRKALLAKALKSCHKKRSRAKRRSCEAQARRRYGARGARAKGRGRGGK